MQDRTVVYSTEVFILGVLLFKKRRVDPTLLIVYQIHIRQLGVLICILERGATSIDEDHRGDTESSPPTMETEATDVYSASNGDCPPRKTENSRMLVDLSANTPNGQQLQHPNSPTENTIKQEDETEDEGDRRTTAEDMGQSGEEGSGLEEPMIDSPNNLQDGVPGSEGSCDPGTRLPNVGKPHKCNYCGRSYKQRISLEEHKERCHNYLQSVAMDPTSITGPYPGEVPKEQRPLAEAVAMATFDRPPVIERLQSNMGKRKSTTPQKFVGEKMMRYSYPELSYDMSLKYEKEAELMQAHMMDQAINNAISYLGSDSLRPLVHHPHPHGPHGPHPSLSMAEVVNMGNPLFHHVYPLEPGPGHRMDRPSSRDAPPHPSPLHPPLPDFTPSSNGPIALTRPKQHQLQGTREERECPSNSGLDSAESARSSPHERLGYYRNHRNNPHPRPRSRPNPANGGREEGQGGAEVAGVGLTAEVARGEAAETSRDGVRVFGREGREVRVFQCEHCCVLFLDHVMYTIHMGCHGYRDPLECNICGHHSKDRYEFSSHIVRGEHTFQ
ncbi:zinc finger protein Helios isoform X2 [Oncorhynchus tshawytscha]|uniref:zinc finger protein Helios isoform X2 n=1 Tax=Oncorhynchus tshawytscha TaxID=74940 RepID=UPI000D09A87C|nr:zinc finger protein Helios isoform X2 [Oncorhynchus tshawytscha]